MGTHFENEHVPVHVYSSPSPAGGSSELTLKPMSPLLQQRQASMRKMKAKRPEKETATTARDEGHDSSLSGAPSARSEDSSTVKGFNHTDIRHAKQCKKRQS